MRPFRPQSAVLPWIRVSRGDWLWKPANLRGLYLCSLWLFVRHMKEFMTPGTVTNAYVNLATRRLKMERPSHVLAHIFILSISDQESADKKFLKGVSTSIEAFTDRKASLDFPLYHIHDNGNQIKNAQASLERGTHFGGCDSILLQAGTATEKAHLHSQRKCHFKQSRCPRRCCPICTSEYSLW